MQHFRVGGPLLQPFCLPSDVLFGSGGGGACRPAGAASLACGLGILPLHCVAQRVPTKQRCTAMKVLCGQEHLHHHTLELMVPD